MGANDKMQSKESEDNKTNCDEDTEFNRWVDSASTMLGCIGNKMLPVEACSISIVPEHVRESNNEAYTPKVISIGPLHWRSKKDLLYMKEIKWHCMLYLLHRTEDPKNSLKECSKAMYELDEVFRASYVDDLKLISSYDLAKIMLLDGCFLLELLINKDERLNNELGIRRLKLPSPGAEIGKREEVLSDSDLLLHDLLLLENQIPVLVLHKLFNTLFPNKCAELEEIEMLVNKLALSLFGYSFDPNTGRKATHLLELFHSYVPAKPSSNVQNLATDDVEISQQVEQRILAEKSNEKRCATKLEAAGIKIMPRKIQKYGVGFDFDIKLKEGTLEIPQLHITGTTEVKWRNFIALEHNRNVRVQFIPTVLSCKFSWYALFIQGLICCEHDIQLLRDREVIMVRGDEQSGIYQDNKKKKKNNKKKEMTNRDLMGMFTNITEGVDSEKIHLDSNVNQLFHTLNRYQPNVNRFTENRSVFSHYVRRLLTELGYKWEKSYEIFKMEYTPNVWKKIAFAYAIFLLGVTILQLFLQLFPPAEDAQQKGLHQSI